MKKEKNTKRLPWTDRELYHFGWTDSRGVYGTPDHEKKPPKDEDKHEVTTWEKAWDMIYDEMEIEA